jgi:hypothetical protein
MAITTVKVHPAIGVARLGNSPDEFFIGPERRWDPPDPPGGFKDAQCRVKRQAARFRVFAYHDDDTIEELTDAEAEISWTVHLVNRKAVTRNTGNAGDLTVDPGSRTLGGPDQREEFDTGQITLPGASAVTVPLGEVRTDDDGRLLVLGGFGTSASPTGQGISSFLNNAGWHDDISDGSVAAHVKIRASGDEFDAVGAWVLVAPPKFAPGLENVITLYDRVREMAVQQTWLPGAPASPSYADDVYPILDRARGMKWVFDVLGAHTWTDPVYDATLRQTIFNRLADPGGGGGDMPMLNSATLTQTQFDVMEHWKDDSFTRDWVAPPDPPDITPEELDRSALSACVGAAFFPGIEAGGIAATPIIDHTKYVGAADPLRLDHGVVSPGDMSEFMALPWQADFRACGSNWWPVPRPNEVIPQGTTSYQDWARNVPSMPDMVTKWHTLGFIVRQGNEYVEVDRCDASFITLLTPHLNFQDVPQGPMGMSRKTALAIAFEVRSTGAAVTLQVNSGDGPTHPRLTLNATSVTVGPTVGDAIATARLWLIYETGPVGETIVDQVTVTDAASSGTWTITVTANTVARKVAAAALVLDRSGSMSEDRGDGQSKHQSLVEAASIMVDVMLEDDGIGIVRFNEDAQPLQGVTTLGPAGDPFDPGRINTKNVLSGAGLNPDGSTSIGDGIFEGRGVLNSAPAGFDVKALVVLTDGVENAPRFIADVAPQIDELTYAVGLGTPQNTSAPALQTISGNHGGYLLVTGAISTDNRFILQKYFLQILAGISNAEIVLDPEGELLPGVEQRIPFQLTEADAGVDVILLTPIPQAVDFRLQTPNGLIIEPWRAVVEPGMAFSLTAGNSYYRLVLPAELVPARFDQAGTWHALLRIGKPRTDPPDGPGETPGVEPRRRVVRPGLRAPADFANEAASSQGRRTLPYSVVVHSYSNLSLRATLDQSGFDPGARVNLHASLTESGIPARAGSTVWAQLTRPDGSQGTVDFAETDPGQFGGWFTTTVPGIYSCRVRATGRSRAGHMFSREQTLTAAVWHGGDRDADPGGPGGPLVHWLQDHDERLCRLLRCLLAEGGVLTPELERRLRAAGFDLPRVRKCLELYCRKTHDPARDG